MTVKNLVQMATLTMAFACAAAQAAPVTPSFASVPTGWTTDRYDPASFANVGTYQGRSDVLGIGITSAGSLANRPAAYQSTFYNTQGKQQVISGAAGSVLAADLYIPDAWRNGAAGSVRTDMWGVMSNPVNSDLDYTIIGFTNYGTGGARLRVWDGDVDGGWVDVMSLANFDRWVSLSIDFTGTSYVYSVDGAMVYTDSTINGSTQFSAVLMQAYNFGDPSLAGANPADYTAHWSNTQDADVPEPGEFALLGIGMLGMVAARRRAKRRA